MSAASGAAAIKMAEFQSGQYKLWPCQLMAELYYPCRAKGMWSELSPNCQLHEDPCFHLTDCSELQIKMGLASMFYQHIGKRTSTFALAVCVGAIGFERGFDRSERFTLLDRTWKPVQCICHLSTSRLQSFSFADYLWETNNKGKLWKDIRAKYETSEEEAWTGWYIKSFIEQLSASQ